MSAGRREDRVPRPPPDPSSRSFTDPSVSMDLLRAVLQPSINEEIQGIFNKYMKVSAGGRWAAAGAWGQLGATEAIAPVGGSRADTAQAVTLSCLFLSSFSRQRQSMCVITLGRRWTQSSSSRRPVGAAWSRCVLVRCLLSVQPSKAAWLECVPLNSFAVTVRGHPQPLYDCCVGIHSRWEEGSSQGWAAHAASSHCCCKERGTLLESHRNWPPAPVRRS